MRSLNRFIAGVAAAAALSAAPAWAQPESTEQRSRALFEKARVLAEQGRWADACPLFQKAHDINSTGGTALQTANCYEKIGQPERALPLYETIVNLPDAGKNPERLRIAEERIRALRAAGVGQPKPPEPAPPPPEAQPDPAPAPAPSAASPAPPPAGTALPQPPGGAGDSGGSSRVPAYVAFGVGGVGLAVGAVAGALALGDAADAKERCVDNVCPLDDEAKRDSAIAKGWISNIGFGVGAVGVAVGIVLLVTGNPAPDKVAADARGFRLRF
jgi:tetratricopeptide (TPR) repeat protein